MTIVVGVLGVMVLGAVASIAAGLLFELLRALRDQGPKHAIHERGLIGAVQHMLR